MYGELTDKETISRIDEVLENQLHDQFEILLYKKNSELKCRLKNETVKPCQNGEIGKTDLSKVLKETIISFWLDLPSIISGF